MQLLVKNVIYHWSSVEPDAVASSTQLAIATKPYTGGILTKLTYFEEMGRRKMPQFSFNDIY